jgi:hypothetical protein
MQRKRIISKVKGLYHKIQIWLSTVLLMPISQVGLAGYVQYQVRPNDNLSSILRKCNLVPIYGDQGYLAKTIKLNERIILKNGNLIFPYTSIFLPIEDQQSDASCVSTLKNVSSKKDNAKQATKISSDDSDSKILAENSPLLTPQIRPASVTDYNLPNPVAPSKESEAATAISANIEMFPKSYIKYSFETNYLRIDSSDRLTQSKGILISKLNLHHRLGWDLHWNELTSTYVGWVFKEDSIEQNDQGVELLSQTKTRHEIFIGLSRNWNDFYQTSFEIHAGEHFFMRAVSPQKISLDRISLASLSILQNYKFFEIKNASLSVLLKGTYLSRAATSRYTIDSGLEGLVGVSMAQSFKDFEIKATGFYGQGEQNTSIEEKKEKNIGILLQLQKSIGFL